jgi:hypothetical protein
MSDEGNIETVQERSLSYKSISIKLGSSQRSKVFSSPVKLREFISKEEENFSFLSQQTVAHVRAITTILNGFYLTVFRLLEGIAVVWESSEEDQLNHLINDLELCLNDFYVPLTNTFIGKNIIKLSKSDPTLASMIVFSSLAPNLSTSNNNAKTMLNQYDQFVLKGRNAPTPIVIAINTLNGSILAANRLLMKWEAFGNTGDLETYRKSLGQATEELNLAHENSILQCKEIEKWLDNKNESLNSTQVKIEEKADALFLKSIKKGLKGKVKLQNKVKSDISGAIERLNTAETTYKEKVELNESVGYWQTKENNHRDERKNWFYGVIGLVVATLLLPLVVMGTTAWATNDLMKEYLVLGVLNPLVITATLISLSLCTFGVRFCSRQFSSAKHLELEATERRTMILTYLALMSENKLKEQEDRKVALDTLFRPSQTGIVAEAGSIMPTDSVIKVLDKRTTS